MQDFAKVCKNFVFQQAHEKINALNKKRFLKLRHKKGSEKGSHAKHGKIRKARTGAGWRGVAAKITFAHFCTTAPKKDGEGEGKSAA
ncbi:hypothetical protein NGB58_25320 [Escherichia coli]|nr:hypothetical protein [Escherichia coli]